MKKFKIGEEIRCQRVLKGISQEAVAYHLGISQAAYSKIERDETEITVARVYEIADLLQISALRLLPAPKYASGIHSGGIRAFFAKVRNLFRFGKKRETLNTEQ